MKKLLCALVAVAVFAVTGAAEDKKAQKQNQMVKGTVKSINVKDGVLIVSQKLKNSTVDRQLDIKPATEFVITIGGEKKEVNGKEGLEFLKEGVMVNIKCDKDVNVLRVTATLKK